jgi:hypothetical protein
MMKALVLEDVKKCLSRNPTIDENGMIIQVKAIELR